MSTHPKRVTLKLCIWKPRKCVRGSMAQQHNLQQPVHPLPGGQASKKRKDRPSDRPNPDPASNKRPKVDHRSRQRDARTIAKQISSTAFQNGELNVEKFIKSREYEIRALEDGMSKSKQLNTKRAFQQVPKELRRRTASHNVKRMPKRLRTRAKREVCCCLSNKYQT